MAKVTRSRPFRPAWLYPAGTTLTYRDGRVFEVVWEKEYYYSDDGMAGMFTRYYRLHRAWKQVTV